LASHNKIAQTRGLTTESQGRTKTFAVLKPRLRHVPQEVIRSRWDVVPQSVHARIRELLKMIEQPVITTGQPNGRMGTAAQVAVTSVLRTWVTRVLAPQVSLIVF